MSTNSNHEKCKSKINDLEFLSLDYTRFTRFLKKHGSSNEIGTIGSQFEKMENDPNVKVEVLGLFKGDLLLSCASFGVIKLLQPKNGIGCRLDVIVTDQRFRENRLGSFVIAKLFGFFCKKYGKNLYNVSTIAAHPMVQSLMKKYGLETIDQFKKAPRYFISFNDISRQKFLNKCEEEFRMVGYNIQQKCAECRSGKCSPWCS